MGKPVPFGTKLLFACRQNASCRVAVELCEDLWAPVAPSAAHAQAGATVVLNLSASDEVIGKAQYRRALVSGQSARLLCGYLYADAGEGESSTDLVFAGHNLIAENGALLAEAQPFSGGMAVAEIDTERLCSERMKNTSFPPCRNEGYCEIPFDAAGEVDKLVRAVPPTPFVPAERTERLAAAKRFSPCRRRG